MSFAVFFYYSLGEFRFNVFLPSFPDALRLSLRIWLLLSHAIGGACVLCARPVDCEGAKGVFSVSNLWGGGSRLSVPNSGQGSCGLLLWTARGKLWSGRVETPRRRVAVPEEDRGLSRSAGSEYRWRVTTLSCVERDPWGERPFSRARWILGSV
jgi:hypothetical protein